ncbi:MAG: AAA family ATPase, partial [Lachnospiraceae bacterium]|nr:AAA family ATPase [Lachnospiraceae bacterium]
MLEENFEKLFGGTYICDHKTAYANSYHLLKLDLSKVTATRERAKPSFANAVRRTMAAFAHLTQLPIVPLDIQEPNELLDDFLDQYRVLCPDTKLYLMIDEYDNFANEFLGKDKPYFDSIFQPDMINKTQETEAAESTQVSEAHFGVSTSSV